MRLRQASSCSHNPFLFRKFCEGGKSTHVQGVSAATHHRCRLTSKTTSASPERVHRKPPYLFSSSSLREIKTGEPQHFENTGIKRVVAIMVSLQFSVFYRSKSSISLHLARFRLARITAIKGDVCHSVVQNSVARMVIVSPWTDRVREEKSDKLFLS